MPRRTSDRLRWIPILLALVPMWCGSCRRSDLPTGASAEHQPEDQESNAQDNGPRLRQGMVWNKGQPLNVLAAWYDVPDESLAKRRADREELTAAHNQLPIGTLVEVTNPQNGKSVRVRITDRGIHDGRVKLDLCKAAAEQLDIVGQGLARVRMQVVSQLAGGTSDGGRASSSP